MPFPLELLPPRVLMTPQRDDKSAEGGRDPTADRSGRGAGGGGSGTRGRVPGGGDWLPGGGHWRIGGRRRQGALVEGEVAAEWTS
ncbi:hypothetical protein Kpho01_09470 [Kitasatospora phosalacinea]|uniref:Uncharacterized protein n=1 Tax=Kitasatospora phosalacinea TaxID=2065 RepID=A0A9W6PDI3_9ACTN|nr:hypothetical protein Kpho01_09470 [Kitasatospora phosalacinea]